MIAYVFEEMLRHKARKDKGKEAGTRAKTRRMFEHLQIASEPILSVQ